MCIVCGPGGSRLFQSIAASFAAPGGGARPRFVAEEVAPAFVPPLDPTDLEDLKGSADVILRGGPILTMGPSGRVAEAIAVRAGRIQSVGDEETALAFRGRLTRIVDLDGRALLPGFVVADWRPPISLLCDWLEADATPAAALGAAISDRSGEWLALRGRGSVEDRPLSALLAAASRPVVAVDETGGVLAANAAALSLAPELAATEPKQGSPTHVSALLPRFLARLAGSRDPLRGRLRALMGEASRNGVTMLRYCGLGALAGGDDVNLLRSAAGDASPLRLRGSIDARLAREQVAAGLRAGAGDDRVRIDTATRWIDEDFAEPADLAAEIAALRKRGWRVTLHASASSAIDRALEAFETAASAGTPLGVADGLELPAPLSAKTSARLLSLGLSAGLLIEEAIAPDDAALAFVATAGVPVSVSLDRMVGGPAPLRTLAAAAAPSGSRPRAGDWLTMITRDGAICCGAGAITGSLEVGKYADFVFLDDDPRDIPTSDFGRLSCVGTWIAGREISP